MDLTRIVADNAKDFAHLLPEGEVESLQNALGMLDENGVPVAAALLSSVGRGVSLDWFFVHPNRRREGIGTRLMDSIKELLAGEAEILSLSYADSLPSVDPFLIHCGFLVTGTDPVYTVTAGEAAGSPLAEELKKLKTRGSVKTIAGLTPEETESLRAFAREEIGSGSIFNRCDPSLSFVSIGEDEAIDGCLLVEKAEEEAYLVSLLYSADGSNQSMHLLRALLTEGLGQKKRSALLRFIAVTDSVERMVERLYPKGAEIMRAELSYAAYAL